MYAQKAREHTHLRHAVKLAASFVDLAVAIVVFVVAYFGVVLGGFARELALFASPFSGTTSTRKRSRTIVSDAVVCVVDLAVAVVVLAVTRIRPVGVWSGLDLVDASGFPAFQIFAAFLRAASTDPFAFVGTRLWIEATTRCACVAGACKGIVFAKRVVVDLAVAVVVDAVAFFGLGLHRLLALNATIEALGDPLLTGATFDA